MPMLAKLQKEMPSDVAIVPIAFDNSDKAKDYLQKKSIDVWSLLDEGGTVASLYGAHALPKTILIDRDGIVVRVFLGKLSETELRAAIQAAMK
jgi:peroxiredoxin